MVNVNLVGNRVFRGTRPRFGLDLVCYLVCRSSNTTTAQLTENIADIVRCGEPKHADKHA